MAKSMMQKFLGYVGLSDDGFEDEDYADPEPRRQASPRLSSVRTRYDEDDFQEPEHDRPQRAPRQERLAPVTPLGKLRTSRDPYTSGPTMLPPSQASSVRTIAPDPVTPMVVSVTLFKDAKEISDAFKVGRSVIFNLQQADSQIQRRLVDFCSGVAHGLNGKLEKIADQVFLMTPSSVSDEDRAKLKSRDFQS